jgi:hypothetical protein
VAELVAALEADARFQAGLRAGELDLPAYPVIWPSKSGDHG